MSPPSLPVFYFTTAVTGLGFGFLYLSAVSIIELYFNRYIREDTHKKIVFLVVGPLRL